jgi:hypothetical protein
MTDHVTQRILARERARGTGATTADPAELYHRIVNAIIDGDAYQFDDVEALDDGIRLVWNGDEWTLTAHDDHDAAELVRLRKETSSLAGMLAERHERIEELERSLGVKHRHTRTRGGAA